MVFSITYLFAFVILLQSPPALKTSLQWQKGGERKEPLPTCSAPLPSISHSLLSCLVDVVSSWPLTKMCISLVQNERCS